MRNMETRPVREDNTIRYNSNRYSVPISFCKPGVEVGIFEEGGLLIIFDLSSNRIVAKHKVSLKHGILVRNNNHYRDYSEKLSDLYKRVLALLNNTREAKEFLDVVYHSDKRHVRDQLFRVERMAGQYPLEHIEKAIKHCLQENICSASKFKAAIEHLSNSIQLNESEQIDSNRINSTNFIKINVRQRDIKSYTNIFKKEKENGK